jgi:putative ABC transport system substrate-binding protein
VIVTVNNEAVREVKRVTNAVPIVMAACADPVGAGLVAGLARPGGNITGFSVNAGPEVQARRLQLLKEGLPEATRVAFLGLRSDWQGPERTGLPKRCLRRFPAQSGAGASRRPSG